MTLLSFLTRVWAVALLALPATAHGQAELSRAPFADLIGEREVAFLARDLGTDTDYVLEGSDLTTRHAPWSSFKMPNLLLALETGAAQSLDEPFIWDVTRRPARGFWPGDWRQDQTLGSAFQRSVPWVFQDVALEIGAAEYRARLGEWGYGNVDIPDGADDFWLGGPLRISVAEQVAFLDRFFMGTLGLEAAHAEALIEVSEDGQFGAASLHGKTGSGPVAPGQPGGPFEGWYVGFLLSPDAEPVVFALYTRAANYSALREFRRDFAIRLLQSADLLPPG